MAGTLDWLILEIEALGCKLKKSNFDALQG
jgi:hypothetical protein